VRLDATPAGELVYRQLAFVPEYALARMERLPDVSSSPLPLPPVHWRRRPPLADAAEPAQDDTDAGTGTGTVRVMDDEDLDDVLALDRDVFGADRAALLRMLRQEAPGYAIVERRGSRLEGYTFGRHGFSFDQLGPIIACDEGVARRLAGHVVASHPRVAFLLDVPRRSAAWVAWLGDIGFREQRGFVRLVRGAPAAGGGDCEPRLFATIGADFG
jgi:hypothetical protein